MPGSWADGAAEAAGCAGGVGWFWRGGWEGDCGWFIARTQLSALREGRGCWCVWGALRVLTEILMRSAKGSTLLPALLVTRQRGTGWCSDKCCDTLLQSAPGRFYPWTRKSLALLPGGPFSHFLTCCQPRNGAECGAMLLKIISIKGPLGHSATLSHAMSKDVVLHCLNMFPPSK